MIMNHYLPKGTSPSDHTQHANAGFQFFKNNRDFEVLSNATERIFPKDDLGPGAIGLVFLILLIAN